MVTDGEGTPLAVHITAGQAHESTAFEEVVTAVRVPQRRGRPRCRPKKMAGDKGYDIPWIRQWLRSRGIKAVIPEKSKPHGRRPGRPPAFEEDTYRKRNVIERCIGWLKQARRIATRFEKLALNFLAMLKIAMIQRYLRTYLRDRT